MCLLAILYQSVPDAPLLLAANREEFFDRPFDPPCVLPGPPRILAGIDLRAGGTWLGVNQFGLIVAITNRQMANPPADARSRGQLCRDLLLCSNAEVAASLATAELTSGRYAGANYVVADANSGYLLEHADEFAKTSLSAGLHLVTNGQPNDPWDPRQSLARELFAATPIRSADDFINTARQVCAHGPEDATGRTIVVQMAQRGTVSSTLMALTTDPAQSVYEFAAGAPDVTPYGNYSSIVRTLLANK